MLVFKNRAALLAALGLLMCFGYAVTSPMARSLPDIPEARQINQTICDAQIEDVTFFSSAADRTSLHALTGSMYIPDWNPSGAEYIPACYSPDALLSSLQELRFQHYIPVEEWSSAQDESWLRRYGQPYTLRIAGENGFLYLHFWNRTRQVVVTRFTFAEGIGGTWGGTAVYFIPLGNDLRSIVRTAYRFPKTNSTVHAPLVLTK